MSDQGDSAVVRFSTAGIPEQDRVAVWREHLGKTVLKIGIEPARDAVFEASLVARALPGLQMSAGTMSAVRITRTRELLAADSTDDFALVINRTGFAAASARGREVALREGDAVLMSSSEVASLDRYTHGGSLSLRIPRTILTSLALDADDAVMNLIPRDSEALALLTSYANALLGEQSLRSPDLRRTVVTHVHDLVALMLRPTCDAAEIARGRGLRAARLRAAKVFVVENSRRRDLSIGHVAAHLGVTPRYLQRLFEWDGTTFSAFLLAQRLARAHRMLTELKSSESAVSSVAYDVGFGDLSYFNRCFKQHFGATPRDIRDGVGK
jgi:AraC-like DNA-binding protein